jgi:hypothetical protein
MNLTNIATWGNALGGDMETGFFGCHYVRVAFILYYRRMLFLGMVVLEFLF